MKTTHALLTFLFFGCSQTDAGDGAPRPLPGQSDVPSYEAAQKVRDLYALLADGAVNVAGTVEDTHYYRVDLTVASKEPQTKTVYVTKDGRYLAEQLTDIDFQRGEFQKARAFAECLKDKDVRIFVQSQNKDSLSQLEVVGRFAAAVAVDCSAAPENCQEQQITEFPSIRHKEKVHVGAKNRAWFESLTGCK